MRGVLIAGKSGKWGPAMLKRRRKSLRQERQDFTVKNEQLEQAGGAVISERQFEMILAGILFLFGVYEVLFYGGFSGYGWGVFKGILWLTSWVLFYFFGRGIIGKWMFWVCLLSMVNPWMLEVLSGGGQMVKGGELGGGAGILIGYFDGLFESCFAPLFVLPGGLSEAGKVVIEAVLKVFAGVSFCAGSVWGFYKFRWKFLVLFGYLLVFSAIGIFTICGWPIMLICFYGVCRGWECLCGRGVFRRILEAVIWAVFLLLGVICFAGYSVLTETVKFWSSWSFLLYGSMGAVFAFFVVGRLRYDLKFILRETAVSFAVMAMLVVNFLQMVR